MDPSTSGAGQERTSAPTQLAVSTTVCRAGAAKSEVRLYTYISKPTDKFIFFLDKVHVVIVMEHDMWETQEWMEPKFASLAAKTSELIRLLCDAEQVKSQEPENQVVARS